MFVGGARGGPRGEQMGLAGGEQRLAGLQLNGGKQGGVGGDDGLWGGRETAEQSMMTKPRRGE